MRKFLVTVGADNAPPIITEAVEASDPNQAMLIVLELFKFDERVMDSKTWNITIAEADDA